MNKKLKIPAIIFLFLMFLNVYGSNLQIKFINKSKSNATVKFEDSNTCDSFPDILIPAGKTQIKNLDFSDNFYINLLVTTSKNNKKTATKIQVVHNYTYNKELKNYIPGSGHLSGFGCAWQKSSPVNVINIVGEEYLCWLPLFHDYQGELSIVIKSNSTQLNQNKLEFTLFSINKTGKVNDIKLNSTDSTAKNINKDVFKLDNWGIKHKSKIKSKTYYSNSKLTRWVDLIIHNFTINSYLFYAFLDNHSDSRIQLNYGETLKGFYTIFYPPQSQLRSASFRFDVLQDDTQYTPIKQNGKNNDAFYLLIGAKIQKETKTLEYIPLQIHSGIDLGKTFKENININAYKEHAYNTMFTPVNVSFRLNKAQTNAFKNKIRIPLTSQGQPIFTNIKSMKNIKLTLLPHANTQIKSKNNRVGIRYIISAESEKGTIHYYKIIMIAPPFLTGNTPGYFSPGPTVNIQSELSNYMRYPLHMYVLPVDKDGNEIQLTGKKTSSDLPSDMIGSIEYFISDTINQSDL